MCKPLVGSKRISVSSGSTSIVIMTIVIQSYLHRQPSNNESTDLDNETFAENTHLAFSTSGPRVKSEHPTRNMIPAQRREIYLLTFEPKNHSWQRIDTHQHLVIRAKPPCIIWAQTFMNAFFVQQTGEEILSYSMMSLTSRSAQSQPVLSESCYSVSTSLGSIASRKSAASLEPFRRWIWSVLFTFVSTNVVPKTSELLTPVK